MNNSKSQLRAYVSPKAQLVRIGAESPLATSGNPSITNPTMPWEGRDDQNTNPSVSTQPMLWENQW